MTITVNNINYTSKIKDSKAIFNVTGLAVNTYPVIIKYLGDDSYNSSDNKTTLTVVKADLEATVIGQNITVNDNSAFFVSVPDDFNGLINITVDNIKYSGNVSSLISMDKLSQGSKTAEVVFWNDTNYNDLTLKASFTVSKVQNITILTIKADNMTRGWNSPYDYQAAFLDSNGKALANTKVQFKVNGKTYTVKTNDDGIAQLTTSQLAVGTYDITSINTKTGQQVTTKLKIVKRITGNKDLTMDFNSKKYFKVKVIGDNGKVAPKGEIVDIYINTIHYVAKVDDKGYAKLQINLNPKTYKVVVEYKTYKTANKIKVKQTLKLVKKTVSVKKTAKKLILKAQLKWTNGKAIKGKVIKFKFRGKTYKAKTNSKGLAKVTVKKSVIKKLKKGKKYGFAATYLSNVVKGKVSVKK